MATHSSILAWKFPWTEEPGGLQSIGSLKSWTWLSDWTMTTAPWGGARLHPTWGCGLMEWRLSRVRANPCLATGGALVHSEAPHRVNFWIFWSIVDLQCYVSFWYWYTAKWFYIYLLFQIIFQYRLLKDIEFNSLCYTVGSLSILHIVVCIYINPKLLIYPPSSPLVTINLFLCESISVLLLFSSSVVSNCLLPHELQHARLPYSSPPPGFCSNSCPLSWWCHPTISSSVTLFCPQSFPALVSFPKGWLFASGGQSIGAPASASVLPVNI